MVGQSPRAVLWRQEELLRLAYCSGPHYQEGLLQTLIKL